MAARSPRVVELANRALLILGLGAALPACHTPSTKLPLDPEVAVANEQGGGEARERIDPLPVEAPADLLPADTMGLVEFSDPAEFMALTTALGEFPEFTMVRGELSTRLGVDLFDEAGWRAAGLDPSGPVGIGLLELESQSGFAYVKLLDAVAFETFLIKAIEKLSRGERLPGAVDVGQGRIIRIDDDVSVIIREGYAVAVLSDRADRARRDYFATVATIDPREALSRSPGFAWVSGRRAAEDDAMIFVAPQAVLAELERGLGGESNDYGVSYARDELDSARQRGASVEEISELERRLEEEREWQRRRNQERQAALDLGRRVFGSIGGAFLAGDLRDDGASFHGAAQIPGESLLGDLFVPVSVESPLLRALDEPLLAAIDGQIDTDSWLELIDLVARADGSSVAELNAEAQAETGINFLTDVYAKLDGRGGFMLTEAQAIDPSKLDWSKRDQVLQSFGVAAYLGLREPKPIVELLDRLSRDKRYAGVLSQAKRGGGWTVAVPEWRDLELRVVGDQLVLSTDGGLATRIDKAQEGKQAATLAAADHPLRGPVATPAMRMYQRWRWVALTSTSRPWTETADAVVSDVDNNHPTLSPAEAAKVPKSKAFKTKYKELEKVIDDINAYNHRRASRELEQALELTDVLGELGIQVEKLGDGLAVHGDWRMAQGTNLLEIGVKMMTVGRSDDWAEYDRLMTRRYELREELWSIRQADLDAAAK